MSAFATFTGLALMLAAGFPTLPAYIDPGTGSYLLQVLIGSLLGVLFMIKMYWQRLKRGVAGFFTGSRDTPGDR